MIDIMMVNKMWACTSPINPDMMQCVVGGAENRHVSGVSSVHPASMYCIATEANAKVVLRAVIFLILYDYLK